MYSELHRFDDSIELAYARNHPEVAPATSDEHTFSSLSLLGGGVKDSSRTLSAFLQLFFV